MGLGEGNKKGGESWKEGSFFRVSDFLMGCILYKFQPDQLPSKLI